MVKPDQMVADIVEFLRAHQVLVTQRAIFVKIPTIDNDNKLFGCWSYIQSGNFNNVVASLQQLGIQLISLVSDPPVIMSRIELDSPPDQPVPVLAVVEKPTALLPRPSVGRNRCKCGLPLSQIGPGGVCPNCD